jgi:hypothetical protein
MPASGNTLPLSMSTAATHQAGREHFSAGKKNEGQ